MSQIAHFAFKFLSDIFYITFCMNTSINQVKCACKGQCAKRKGRGACKCHEGNKKCHELCSCDKRKCKNKVCSCYFAIIAVKRMMQEAPHNSVSLISGKRGCGCCWWRPKTSTGSSKCEKGNQGTYQKLCLFFIFYDVPPSLVTLNQYLAVGTNLTAYLQRWQVLPHGLHYCFRSCLVQ